MRKKKQQEQEPPKLRCVECGEDKRIDVFGIRADGTRRSKCNACLRGYNNPNERKIQPAPSDIHPLPSIVRKALENPQQEIETFDLLKNLSNNAEKITGDVLAGKRKYVRGGKA